MRIEFRQGVPEGCVEWLYENVGPGKLYENVGRGNLTDINDSPDYAWFYRRERVYPQPHEAFDPRMHPKYVPTITIKDEKKAMWFALRWSS